MDYFTQILLRIIYDYPNLKPNTVIIMIRTKKNKKTNTRNVYTPDNVFDS